MWGAYRRQFFSVPWKEPVSELCSRATISAAALAERYSRTQSPSAAAAAERLMILADPNAARFYERSGAVRIGEPPFGRRARPAAALRDQARSHSA